MVFFSCRSHYGNAFADKCGITCEGKLKSHPCGMPLNNSVQFDHKGQTIINIPIADRGDSAPGTFWFVGTLTPLAHNAQQRQ